MIQENTPGISYEIHLCLPKKKKKNKSIKKNKERIKKNYSHSFKVIIFNEFKNDFNYCEINFYINYYR